MSTIKNKIVQDLSTVILVGANTSLATLSNTYTNVISSGAFTITLPLLANSVVGQQITVTSSSGIVTVQQAEDATGGNNLVINEANVQGSTAATLAGKSLTLVVSTATVLTVPNTRVWRVILKN